MGFLLGLPMPLEVILLLLAAWFFRHAAVKGWVTGRTYRRNIPLFLVATAASIPLPGSWVFPIAILWTCVLIARDGLFPRT